MIAVLAGSLAVAEVAFAASGSGQLSETDSDESITMSPATVTGNPGETAPVTVSMTASSSRAWSPVMVFTVPAGTSAANFVPSSGGSCTLWTSTSIHCVWSAGAFVPGATFTATFQAIVPSSGSSSYTLSQTEAVTGFTPLTTTATVAVATPVADPLVIGSVVAGGVAVGFGAALVRRRRAVAA